MRIILLTFSQFVRGFWQFWSLGGFDLMVLALPSSAQASFFCEADDESYASATATDRSSESIVIAERKRISYSQILTYALPTSPKVIEFNNLIDLILVSQQQTSLISRDDSKTAEAMILLSNILNEHWHEFPLKVKVLLLNKLKVFRKNLWKSIFTFNTFSTIISRFNYYKGYWNELRSYDNTTQQDILKKVSRDSRLLRKAWLTLKTIALKIFKNSGYLLHENVESISEFTNSVKTMLAARGAMSKYSGTLDELAKFENNTSYQIIERTPEETAEGLRKIKNLFKRQEDLWNSMTKEEQETSNSEFLICHEELMKSRSE
jgi:hypothetical protein